MTPNITKTIIEFFINDINSKIEKFWLNNKRLIAIPSATPISRVGQKEKLIKTFSFNE